jgi:shikimate kinase
MNRHGNLFFIGPTGAGKTTIGKRVARHFGLEFLDLDHEIERHTGADIALIFDIEGEAGFRHRESAMLDELTTRTGILLATGGGAVLDEDNRRLLSSRGFVVYLRTPVDRQIERLSRDKRRPLLMAENRDEILQKMAQHRNPIYEQLADIIVPSESVSVATMSRRVIARLEQDNIAFQA